MEERLLRLKEIIGDRKTGLPAIIPISKSTWWAGVASKRYPQPVRHLGPRITAWRASEIYALVSREV
jgi:predicted DNA-binding transcriptional regulator AlpA